MQPLFSFQNSTRDIRHSVRSLGADWEFSLVAVLALSLGIGASTIVFSVFYNLLFNAVAAKDAEQLVVPVIVNAEQSDSSTGLFVRSSDLAYLKEHNHVFEGLIGYRWGRAMVQSGSRRFQLANALVTPDAFEFYGVPPLLGRGISSEDGRSGAPQVFALSYSTWKIQFGSDPDVVGKSFIVNEEPRTLVGVMPDRFHAFGSYQDMFTPIPWASSADEARNGAKVNVLARLKRGVTRSAASAEFDLLARQLAATHPNDEDYPKKFNGSVVGARDYLIGISSEAQVFNSKIKLQTILYDLLVAVLVLLLIACSNVANLLLARATVREKELAVRSALGASRLQIVGQLMIESLVLALTACIVGCLLAWGGMKLIDHAVHRENWAQIGGEAVVGLNVPVLFFAVGIALLTTVLCGLVPALRATRGDLQPTLIGGGKGLIGGLLEGKVRTALVSAQVALSIVLLVGAGLMIRSLYKLTHIDLGFDSRNLIVLGFAPARSTDGLPDRAFLATPKGEALFAGAVEKIMELPSVEGVAVNNTIPAYGPSRGPKVTVPGQGRTEQAGLDECDENCSKVLGLHILAGRWLSRDEVATQQHVTVLNARLAHDMFGDANPIGKQIEVKDFDRWKGGLARNFQLKSEEVAPNTSFQIVGIVADVKNAGPQQPAVPMAFIPPLITGSFIVQVRTKVSPKSILNEVENQVWAADPSEVFWISGTLDDFLEQHTYTTPEFGVALSGPLAVIALFLVIIGVFSVMAYSVSLRTQEIGVRMALGAQPIDIVKMVLRRSTMSIAAGICIGLLGSFAVTRFLTDQLWGVSATDRWTFVTAIALVAAAGIAACYLPARRASLVDPLVALRYE